MVKWAAPPRSLSPAPLPPLPVYDAKNPHPAYVRGPRESPPAQRYIRLDPPPLRNFLPDAIPVAAKLEEFRVRWRHRSEENRRELDRRWVRRAESGIDGIEEPLTPEQLADKDSEGRPRMQVARQGPTAKPLVMYRAFKPQGECAVSVKGWIGLPLALLAAGEGMDKYLIGYRGTAAGA